MKRLRPGFFFLVGFALSLGGMKVADKIYPPPDMPWSLAIMFAIAIGVIFMLIIDRR